MDEPEQGIIRYTIDEGTIVQVGILTDAGGRVLAADGNAWRCAVAAIGKPTLCGERIEFSANKWGGIEWFSIIESGYVVCPNCQRHIAPHLDPAASFFGMHRRKHLPTNGVHDAE